MTFLTGLLATILQWAIQKFTAWGILKVKEELKDLDLQKQAKADADALVKAKTDDEAKAALGNSINNTFKS